MTDITTALLKLLDAEFLKSQKMHAVTADHQALINVSA